MSPVVSVLGLGLLGLSVFRFGLGACVGLGVLWAGGFSQLEAG